MSSGSADVHGRLTVNERTDGALLPFKACRLPNTFDLSAPSKGCCLLARTPYSLLSSPRPRRSGSPRRRQPNRPVSVRHLPLWHPSALLVPLSKPNRSFAVEMPSTASDF